MLNYILLLKQTAVVLGTVILFSLIFLAAGYKTEDWNGLDKENDDTLSKKYGNRLYFSIISFSTLGYGDITPKKPLVKGFTCFLAIIILLELSTLFLIKNDKK